MTDEHRPPAPWERPLSKIRHETPDSDADPADQPRSRRRRADDSGERLTVAELLQRVGQPEALAPTRSRAANERENPEQDDSPEAGASEAGISEAGAPEASEAPDNSEPATAAAATPPAESPSPEAEKAGAEKAGADKPGAETPGPPTSAGPKTGPAADPWLDQQIIDAAAQPPVIPPKAGPTKVSGADGPPPKGPTLPTRKKLQRAGMVLVALGSVLAVTLTGMVWGYLRVADGALTQIAALDQNSEDVRDPGGQYGDETYLIVGTDSRAGANGEMGAGTTEEAGGARSDTVIVVNIPADRSRVVAVSFPRDLNVDRPSCHAWDNEAGAYTSDLIPGETDVKLNSVYQDGGPKCLVKVIQKMSGLQINHFVGMDFAGFEQMVNTIGGVEVCTTEPLVDEELGTVLPQTGKQTISGSTALDYVRARKVESEGNGDYGRIKRQQVFLSSLLRTALSNKVLLDPGKLNGFINEFTNSSFGDNLDTQALITLGRSLQRVEAGKVTFLTVPTAGTNDWGNEIPRTSDIRSIFDAIIDDMPLPGEQADTPTESADPSTTSPDAVLADRTPAPQIRAVSPSSVTVQVSNASGYDGVATAAADRLGAYGFQIYNVGNYTSPVSGTIVQFSGDNEAEAATIAAMIPGAQLQRTSGLGNIVEVVLGSDYSGTVISPANPGDVITSVLASDTEAGASIPLDVSVTNAADTTCA